MFCPNCGLEDTTQNQFCRSCGTSLHVVRSAIEHPDAITKSAVTAREEIGRAIAAKIAEFEDANEVRQAVYEILPAIERFLESPEEQRWQQREQRLNKIRGGVLTSVVGLAITLTFMLISWLVHEEKILIVSALGLLVLIIGLGVTATALWLTVLKPLPNVSSHIPTLLEMRDEQGDEISRHRFRSVTEGTTREL